MQNKSVVKIYALGIVLVFFFGAFAPAIGAEDTSVAKAVPPTIVNDQPGEMYEEVSDQVVADSGGGIAPLDTPHTFYDAVGRTYTKPSTYMQLVTWYQNLEQNYSNYIQVFKANELYGTGTIPKTGGGSYDLYYVRVTNESRGLQKPEVFFSGQAHGNERIGVIGLYWTVDWLMRHAYHPDYNCPERPYLQWLLDNREIYIEITHNPDGFDRNVRGDYLNRDLNREADHDATFGPFASVNGVTIRDFFENHQIRTALWFHAGTRKLLYPWQSEHSAISGTSPISGKSYGHVPADFYFFDAAGLQLGDYIGDYGGNLGPNEIGTSYTMSQGGPGCLDSWAYGGNDLKNPAESSYVEQGPYLGAGVFAWDPEVYGNGDPAQSMYGNDSLNRFGAEIRRQVLYMTDIAQPSVHWANGTSGDSIEVTVGENQEFSWIVNGCLVVDNTRMQYSTDPDPISNPLYYTTNIDDNNGDYYGGSYWDDANDGSSTPTMYQQEITFDTPGDYFIVAKAMVDQKYAEVSSPSHYGVNSYLRMINERTNGSFSESLVGTDGLEEIDGQLWWYSPVIHVHVTGAGLAPWYDSAWAFRKEISLNHSMVIADLASFPVLIDITDPALVAHAQANGNDLLFTDGFNHKLNHEIEYFSAGHLVAWVNVPVLLASQDTTLYLYYGNGACGSQQNVSGVWDSHYMLVEHLKETSGTQYDSTSHDNDGTPHNGVLQGVTGVIDGADDFDGTNDYVQIPHSSSISGFTSAVTMSAWFRTDGNTMWTTILNKYNTSNSQRGWQVYYDGSASPKALHFVLASSATSYVSYQIDFDATVGMWYLVECVWTSGQLPTIYINGVSYTPSPSTLVSSVYNNPVEPLYIGRAYIGGTSDGRFFNGMIDEVRISDMARSAAWIRTSYLMQADPAHFVSLGLEEGPMFIFNPSPLDKSNDVPRSQATLSFNLTHLKGRTMDYTVETWPDIGSASVSGVADGRFSIPVSGLLDCMTYVWWVNVTDGGNVSSRRFEFTTECQDPWWDGNWIYRKKVSIDPGMVPDDLSDFPVLVQFFDADLAAKAQVDGDDLAFADKNGVQLAHEVEQYQAGMLTAWVKVPTVLAGQDNYFYLYYGNPSATSQESPASVWNENYVMVQHLSETSGTHFDSTSNDNDGTPHNHTLQGISAKIDGGDSLDGTDDYVQVPHDATLAGFTSGLTASIWVNFHDIGSRQTLLNKWETVGSQRGWALDLEQNESTLFGFFGSSTGSTYEMYTYEYLVQANNWYYVTVVWQANQVPKLYVNGVALATSETATLASLYANPSAPLYLGRSYTVTPERYLDGVFDEVQVSNIARSTAWVQASYLNQNNPVAYITLGLEESEFPLVSEPYPMHGATDVAIADGQLSFHLTDRQGDAMDYTVETSPNIGSSSASHVYDGRYEVATSGLVYATTYTWYVNATDGSHVTHQLFSFTTERAPIPWWNTDWSFRKEILIDHTKIIADQTNFPLLLSLNDSDIMVKAMKDGRDIVFADDLGNKLDFELEYYQKGVVEAWVRIPVLSSTTDTLIMVYYGNTEATSQANPAGVWDSNYMMVQHLAETSGTVYDSTANDNDGTPAGGLTQTAIGRVDGADTFDGSNDYISVPHDSTLCGFTVGMTGSCWFKLDTLSARQALFGKYATTGNQRSWNIEYINSPNALQFTASSNGSAVYSYWYANVALTTGTWYYLAVVWLPNQQPFIYLNGNRLTLTLSSGVNLTQIYTNPSSPLYIGRTYTADRYLDGSLDEVQVSNIGRSMSWIKTCYNNMNNPSSYYVVGSEEMGIAPDEPFIYDESPLDGATVVSVNPTLSVNVIDYQDEMIDVCFRTNATGSWTTIGDYPGALSGIFTQPTTTMDAFSTKYYWSLNVSDNSQHWSNRTFSFTTRQENYAPVLSNIYPANGATGIAPIPTLSVTVRDPDANLLTVVLKSNVSGSWQTLQSFTDVLNGTYSYLPEDMHEKGKRYYWSVNCYDGHVWVNQTYYFTMSTTVLNLKWTTTVAPLDYGMTSAGDINHDGADEVFAASSGMAYCLDGRTGSVIWQRSVSGGGGQGCLADCNGDGTLDFVVVISASGIEVLYGTNGTTYWRTTGLGGSSMCKPVAADIDGDGCAEVFYASQDIEHGWNGTGRVTSLTHDGHIVNQIFAYRPCGGGLSLADTNFDGQFELFMGDRHKDYAGDGGVPRGLRAFLIAEDGFISCLWNRSDILMSSHAPIIADYNGDGILEVICCWQKGGIYIINAQTGATIKSGFPPCSDGFPYPGHYQMGVCDIDNDGHLEMLAADGSHPEPYTTDDVAVFDLVEWKEDALLPHVCEMGPTTGDVTGDGLPEILISSFSGFHVYTWNMTTDSAQFVEQRTTSGAAGPAVVTDLDNDGYCEVIVGTSSGHIYVYDVPAPLPDPRPNAGQQFYSTYRQGRAVYVAPPGVPQPVLKDVFPVNKSVNIDVNPTLSVRVLDYQNDLLDITISTNATGPWVDLASYTGMKTGRTYSVACPEMNIPGRVYFWRVSATDDTHEISKVFKLTTYTPAAFMDGWQYRRKIVLNQSQITASLTNFPVLIDLTDAEIGAKAKTNADDLLFTSIDGLSILDYEIESYTSSTGHVVAWVKTNVSSVNGTILYLYYGNATAVSHEDAENVWDSHFMMVQHLSEITGTVFDSTLHHNNGTPLNGVVQDTVGKIDGADAFDGTNDYISVPHNNSLAGFTEGLTGSVWFKLDTTARRQTLLCKYQTTGNQRGYYLDYANSPSSFQLYASPDGIASAYWTAAFIPTAGVWYQVTFAWASNATPKIFVNGNKLTVARTDKIATIYNNTLEQLRIGSSYTTGRQVDGILDEIQISNISRSDAWITTSYRSQNNPSSFCHISDEMTRYALTVTTSGNGTGIVELSSLGPYHPDELVTIWANASTGSVFTGWSGAASGYATPIYILMNSDKSLNAEFTAGLYSIALASQPVFTGTIQKSPEAPAYSLGQVVTLTAVPESGWAFKQWSGDLSGTVNPSSLTVTRNMLVTAVFKPMYDDLVFNSSFEDGNLIDVQYLSGNAVGQRSYTAKLNWSSASYTDKHWWFYYKVSNAAGKTITLKLTDLAADDFQTGDNSRFGNIEPVYSYDNIHWERVALSGVVANRTAHTFTMTMSSTQDTVWFAPMPPYTNSMRDALFAEYASSPYLTISSLGTTPGGLPLKVATITNPAFNNMTKYRVYVIADQHANEVPSEWFADGMIRFLLNESNATAAALREHYIFKIVPIVNVDGVYQGICRYTPFRSGVQYDLNREWSKTVSTMQPEIQWLYNDIQSWHPHAFLDIHSTVNVEGAGGSRDCMYLAPGYNTDPVQIAFMDNISVYWPESAPRTSTGYACAQVQSRLGIKPSISLEHPDDELKSMVPLRKLVSSDWQGWGGQVARGIYRYFGINREDFLVDSELSVSVNDSDLWANTTGQDWYESRHYFTGSNQSLLSLNTSLVGGNGGKKAALKNMGIASNAQLSQEFREALFNPFTVSFDVYVDRIQDNVNYDRTGHIYIGDNRATGDAPTGQVNERFVILAFYDPTPGETGNDLQLRARTLSTQAWATTSQWVQVASGLNYDTWYTLKLVVRPNGTTPSYDVYVNNVLAMANIPKYVGYSPMSVSYVGFASDQDGRGDFLIDNILSPAVPRYRLTTNAMGSGSVTRDVFESTYASGSTVQVTAMADPSWTFYQWTGGLAGSSNPGTVTMDADKTVTAVFRESVPPVISDVLATPSAVSQGELVNITCLVTDNVAVDTVKAVVSGPVGYTPVNQTMTLKAGSYYYAAAYSVPGTYDYVIWANDTSDNRAMSEVGHFTVTANGMPAICCESPLDDSTNLPITTASVSVSITDPESEPLDWTISGLYVNSASGTDDVGGVKTATLITPLPYNTEIVWTVTAYDGTTTSTATYSFTTLSGPYALSTSVIGTGGGTIEASPAGPYYYGAVVTLWANASYGSVFDGWDGALSGTTTPQILIMDADKTVTAEFTNTLLLTDSEFSTSVDSDDLRANATSQDWYESRLNVSTLLTLDTANTGGNTGKKAALKNYGTAGNAYLTQEFTTVQSGIFTVSFDIYIDKIEDKANYDRTGHIYIGNNWNANACPLDTARERYVLLAFYDSTPGDTGTDIQLKARTLSTSAQSWTNTALWPTVASDLSYDTWYTLLITVNYPAGTYDVTINGVTTTWSKMDIYNNATDPAIRYISFAADSDARGDFYVDNVFSPATTRHTLMTTTIGGGSITRTPGESTYAHDSMVELTAVPDDGWEFVEWTGALTGTTNPATLAMDADKTVTATFRETTPPEISDMLATPSSVYQGDEVAITATVTDNIALDSVKVDITGPEGFTPVNTLMVHESGSSYSYTAAYTIAGTYTYYIWAQDTSGNTATSPSYQFTVTVNTAPIIIDNSADTAGTGDSFLVTATITDSDGVSAAYVDYWFGTGSKTNVSLTHTIGDTWEYTSIGIPLDSTSTLHYDLCAKDTLDTWSLLADQQVIVTDDVPPEIMNVLATPSAVAPGEQVSITCSATDNIAVSLVTVSITGPEGFTPVEATMLGSYYYDAVYTIEGTYDFTITASDTNGNSVTTSVSHFTVTTAPSYDDVVFTSNFEMGNLINVQYQSGDALGNRYYTAEIDYTTVSYTEMLWWFHCKMENTAGKTITLTLVNLPPEDFGVGGGAPRWQTMWPVYSYDYAAWSRIPQEDLSYDAGLYTFTMTITPTQDSIWLAPSPPYTVSMRDAFLATYGSSPYLTSYSLGTTPLGLSLSAITITDPTVPDEGKSKVYIISSQHAGETVPTYVAEGMISFLLDETNATASELRQHCIFKIIPIVNVEGVFYGRGRYTPLRSGVQYDLNRQWSFAVGSMQPEIQMVYTEIQTWNPDVFIDLHDDSTRDNCFFYKGGSDPVCVQLMDAIAAYWPEGGSSRVTTSQSAGQVYNRLGIYASVIMEHPHDILAGSPEPKGIADWKTWGQGIARGLYDYFDLTLPPTDLLVDSEFSASADSAELRANSTGQDWYESRQNTPTLLTLDTTNVGGNTGKKGAMKNYGLTGNAYLTQEFSSPQSGVFNVSLDIYIDRIEDNANYDRTGHIFIGNNQAGAYPVDTARERYVLLAFYDSTPGDTGTDIQLKARTSSGTDQSWLNTALWPTVASGLSYDTWYTLKITVNYPAKTYDVTINGVTTTWSKMSLYNTTTDPAIRYISFTGDADGRGDFYVDNVFAPAATRHTLTTSTVGSGAINYTPGESTYAHGSTVELTAVPADGWIFQEWTGSLTGTTNPATITMDANKAISATFTLADTEVPGIDSVSVVPLRQVSGGYVNLSAHIIDNIGVQEARVVITAPDSSVQNITALLTTSGSIYYLNQTYLMGGTYHYRFWATDAAGNHALSAEYTFTVVRWEVTVNVHASGGLNDKVFFGEYDDALDGQDAYDIPKPGMPPAPCVYMRLTTGLQSPYNSLWKEYRQYPGTDQTWSLSVIWSDEGTGFVNLTWNTANITASEYSSVRLHDLDLGTWTDMRSVGYYNCSVESETTRHLEIVCTSAPALVHYEIPIYSEWNMIAVCFNDTFGPDDITVEYLGANLTWAEAVADGVFIPIFYGWDAETQSYEMPSVFEPGESYWLYAYQDCSFWVTGETNPDVVIAGMVPGWNFVGSPFDDVLPKQDLIIRYLDVTYSWSDAVAAGLVMDTVFCWDTESGGYDFADAIEPGRGYWMYAFVDCTLERE